MGSRHSRASCMPACPVATCLPRTGLTRSLRWGEARHPSGLAADHGLLFGQARSAVGSKLCVARACSSLTATPHWTPGTPSRAVELQPKGKDLLQVSWVLTHSYTLRCCSAGGTLQTWMPLLAAATLSVSPGTVLSLPLYTVPTACSLLSPRCPGKA